VLSETSAHPKIDSRPGEHAERSALEIAKLLYKTPALVQHGVRCGKAVCRCRHGGVHGPYAFLIWRDDDGRQRRRYVRQADVPAVADVVNERRRADRAARQARQDALCHLRQLCAWLREVEAGNA
jgi:hypothetical protein